MQSIKIITMYFGKFNNFVPFWMKSVEQNKTVDFVLVTDNKVPSPPKNMTVVNCSFREVQKRVMDFFDFAVDVHDAYKLSEYAVLYALIFPELVGDADFWGYCEMDLILGNLRRFITDEVLNKFDKVYYLGHLTLYRNNEQMNNMPLLNHKYPTDTYKEAYASPNNFHFIEHAMREIPLYEGVRCYYKIDCADIAYKYHGFVLGRGDYRENPKIFKVSNGGGIWAYCRRKPNIHQRNGLCSPPKEKNGNKSKSVIPVLFNYSERVYCGQRDSRIRNKGMEPG